MVWTPGVFACRNRSWEAFQEYLCGLLAACVEEYGRYIVVSRRDKVRYVQFRSLRGDELAGEAVSNDHLTGDEKLGRATLRRLRDLGWRKDGAASRRNFSRRWVSRVDVKEVASLAVTTLHGAYGAALPSNLEVTLGSFHSAKNPYSTVTMISEVRGLQLPSGLVVQNRFSGSAYRVGMPLGAGGFGAVYRVSQVAGPRIPTACVLKAAVQPTAWHREAYFGDLLKDEPAVVRLYESFAWIPSGDSKPLYCLISELMDGGDVQHYLQKQPQPWKESKARYEVIRVLRAVRLLHQGGAVHRDLTPRNVFVTAQGRLKIGDFGIALHGFAQTGVAADVFNPGFAPPAFLAGGAKHWSPADDVFHVGMLFAMLLSGRASSRLSRKQVRDLPCSSAVKAIIQRCIGEKRKRFCDADELLAALEHKIATPHTLRVSSLLGKNVVFTGGMAIKRAQARLLVKRRGGVCQDRVSQTTDVVVVGDQISPSWIAEHKGNKLLDVDREWARGHHIAILTESRFLKLVKNK
jgi:eukaryotic-like serine/threonine-protein kinase